MINEWKSLIQLLHFVSVIDNIYTLTVGLKSSNDLWHLRPNFILISKQSDLIW